MCIVCLMVKAGMSEDATKLAKALFSQMYSLNEVLKLMVKEAPGLESPALNELIATGDTIAGEDLAFADEVAVQLCPEPTPNDVFEAANVFPINRTKH